MIYLFTALYCEASLFIKQFQLEKNLENTRFQEFYNETAGIRLTITGAGEIAAAAAVSSVGTKYDPGEKDSLLNVGICAQKAGGGIFVCNKIIELATGKTFYPDILYSHDFEEKAIVTGMRPFQAKSDSAGAEMSASDDTLYDMEAAAVYQAGSYFLGPHQMVFLKVVSDSGNAEHISEKQVESLMEEYRERLTDFVRRCGHLSGEKEKHNFPMERVEEDVVEKLCADMHCSKTMRDLLNQYIRYLVLAKADYASVIQSMYREGLLPCRDKREGKLRFEEFKRRLW